MYTLSLSHVQTLPPTRKAFLFLSSPHTRNLHSLFFLCIHSYPHTTSLVTHHSSSQSPPWRDSTQTLPKVFYSCSNIFVHQLSPAWRASTQTLPKVFYSCSNIFVHQLSPAWRASTQTPQRYFIHALLYSCTNSHLRGVLPPKPGEVYHPHPLVVQR